ncbi:hypothetical protein HGRIS_003572 [Hohenbuehelia grisea]|uniref:Peptidase C14 caspase domain-containing protein n=1 Tax=Hohenbuehelia grisea TaxID=104357 RepID=A0ABR3JFZ7_9AGAR
MKADSIPPQQELAATLGNSVSMQHSAEEHSSKPDARTPSIVPASPSYERLRALVIGIDDYPSYTKLRGAVADAGDMFGFLTQFMGVPEANIERLLDQQASREAILCAIKAMIQDDRIVRGDPILFYFAGHGCRVLPPKDWKLEGTNIHIEMLCPHDFKRSTSEHEYVEGIPDIMMNDLLSQLAHAKGNNITVILDCCHSGSATRDGSPKTEDLLRSVDVSSHRLRFSGAQSFQDIHVDRVKSRRLRVTPDDNVGMASHVLLAACSENGYAYESAANHRGNFTFQLLASLRDHRGQYSKLTYNSVIDILPKLQHRQSPQCFGVHRSRYLFTSEVPTGTRIRYPIKFSSTIPIILAGSAQGITVGSHFELFGSQHPETPFARGTALKVNAHTTEMEVVGDVGDKSCAWAVQIGVGDSAAVIIAQEDDNELTSAVHNALQQAPEPRFRQCFPKIVAQKAPRYFPRLFGLNPPDAHEVLIRKVGDKAVFEIADPFCLGVGLRHVSGGIPLGSPQPLLAALHHAADFFFHLRRAGEHENISMGITLEMYETALQDNHEPQAYIPKDTTNRIGDDGIARISAVAGINRIPYCLKISSKFERPLYASVISFNMSDLNIQHIYTLPSSKRLEPCIPSDDSLSLGFSYRPKSSICRAYLRDLCLAIPEAADP